MWWWWLCLLLFAGGLVYEPHGFVKYWLKLVGIKRGGRMCGCEVMSREREREREIEVKDNAPCDAWLVGGGRV